MAGADIRCAVNMAPSPKKERLTLTQLARRLRWMAETDDISNGDHDTLTQAAERLDDLRRLAADPEYRVEPQEAF